MIASVVGSAPPGAAHRCTAEVCDVVALDRMASRDCATLRFTVYGDGL